VSVAGTEEVRETLRESVRLVVPKEVEIYAQSPLELFSNLGVAAVAAVVATPHRGIRAVVREVENQEGLEEMQALVGVLEEPEVIISY
jgi:hypothetical protein